MARLCALSIGCPSQYGYSGFAAQTRMGVTSKRFRFVVRRDWNLAKGGKLSAIFQKLYRSEDPAKRSSQTQRAHLPPLADSLFLEMANRGTGRTLFKINYSCALVNRQTVPRVSQASLVFTS